MKNEVALIRCGSYLDEEVYAKVRRAVELLGGMKGFVRPGERILLKPNLLAAKPPEACVTTHPSVVRAVIRLVKEAGGDPFVGDSPGMGTAKKSAAKCGVLKVCEEEGVELVELKTMTEAENPGGGVFRRLEVAEEALGADGIINIPKLKTHAQMYLTMGVKNIFGCVPGKRKAEWHLAAGVKTEHFASMLLELYRFLNPRLTVVDAVLAMEGNGPGNGTPRELGLLFASPSAVALDTVAAEVLGARREDVPTVDAASRMGLEEARLENISVLGEEIKKVRVRDFKFPPKVSANFAAMLPDFLDRRVRKALTTRPHVTHDLCKLCNICVETCPPGIMEKKDRILIDYDGCIRCYCCQEVCPHGAIAPVDGWLKRLMTGIV